MKFIFIIYSILVLHYAIADECSNLFEQKNSTVTFSEEQFKDQPAFFYSLGRKLRKNKEETDEFNSDSFLYLGENHTPYTAKTCIDSILTVSNPTDHSELHLNIANSHPTAIIDDPVNQFAEWQSTCNKLSFPGEYILSVKVPYTKIPYDVKFYINSISRKVLFFNSYASNITYNNSYLQFSNNKKIEIKSCSDYFFSNSSLYYSGSPGYVNIIEISKTYNQPEANYNLCTIMSVKGLYKLFNKGKPIGEIETSNNSNYELYYDFNESKYKLEFSSLDYPSLKDIDNKIISINNCVKYHDLYELYSDGNYAPIFFSNIDVLYQDSEKSRQHPLLLHEQINKQYNLDKKINQIEINNLLNGLQVPIENQPNQLCRQLIYPGKYTINFSDLTTINIHNHDFIQVYTKHNSENNNLVVKYRYILSILNGNDDNNILLYECIDIFNKTGYARSEFKQIEEKDYPSMQSVDSSDKASTSKFITSVTQAVPDSWEELAVEENEGWLDDKYFKLKLRSNKKCLELEKGKKYKIEYTRSDAKIAIGDIYIRKFHRFLGYFVIFKDHDKNPDNLSHLLYYNSPYRVYKKSKTDILIECISNQNSNTLYTQEFKTLKKSGDLHSHNKGLRDSQIKFDTLTEIKEPDL